MNIRIQASALLLCLLLHAPALAADASLSASMKPLAVGQALPDLAFKEPLPEGEARELGVAPGQPFALKDAKAQAVILVVFSMYCPFCQRDAPELARMHQMLKDRGLADKVKLVGLGAGNSAFEVNIFREKFGLRMPLIPDQDFTAYKALGQVGTPFYYVLKRSGQGFTVADAHLGCVASAEAFLNQALAKAGIGGK